MDTSMVIAATILLLVNASIQEQYAQECQVYRLRGGHDPHYRSPGILFHNLLTVSFYNENEGDYPNNVHIILEGSSKGKEKIHINPDGIVAISTYYRNDNFSLSGTCQPNTWMSLAVLLQDHNIIVYRIDERDDSIISANSSLESNVTAFVTSALDPLYITLNCPAGCLMHDKNSPLINRWMSAEKDVNIYVSHETGAIDACLLLGFKDHQHKNRSIKVDITRWEPSLWHKVVVTHDKQKNIIVKGNGHQIGQALMAEDKATFAVLGAKSVLWSLHCHPDHATGLEAWGQSDDNNTDEEDHNHNDKDDEGAGIGEVLAWVLAGIALFLVMIMAFLLCTKMSPARSGSVEYGASVGVVTSFGRQMSFKNAEREAEEDTEPDSPTFLAPVIHHKVPEEEDEQQSNTKML